MVCPRPNRLRCNREWHSCISTSTNCLIKHSSCINFHGSQPGDDNKRTQHMSVSYLIAVMIHGSKSSRCFVSILDQSSNAGVNTCAKSGLDYGRKLGRQVHNASKNNIFADGLRTLSEFKYICQDCCHATQSCNCKPQGAHAKSLSCRWLTPQRCIIHRRKYVQGSQFAELVCGLDQKCSYGDPGVIGEGMFYLKKKHCFHYVCFML